MKINMWQLKTICDAWAMDPGIAYSFNAIHFTYLRNRSLILLELVELAYCGRVKQTAGVEIFCKFWRIGSIEQPKRPKVNGAKDQNKWRNYCIDEACRRTMSVHPQL
jgi:hypothetical protein